MGYLGSLLAPYSYTQPGATPSDILASPVGGGFDSGSSLQQLAQMLSQQKDNSGGGSQDKKGPGPQTKNIGLKNLPDSMNNSVNENRQIAQAIMKRRYPQWNRADYKDLVSLWNRESGWNAKATNQSSGAAGIPQELNHNVSKDFFNSPVAQILWGLRYIRGRYGDPEGAWRHSQATGWY